jgi:hypothetical protein
MEIPTASEKQPASADELVEFIASLAKEHHHRTGRGINGTVPAVLIREEYPALDYAKLGLSKLGDAVRLGEAKQRFQRKRTVQHLEVCPVPSVARLTGYVE